MQSSYIVLIVLAVIFVAIMCSKRNIDGFGGGGGGRGGGGRGWGGGGRGRGWGGRGWGGRGWGGWGGRRRWGYYDWPYGSYAYPYWFYDPAYYYEVPIEVKDVEKPCENKALGNYKECIDGGASKETCQKMLTEQLNLCGN